VRSSSRLQPMAESPATIRMRTARRPGNGHDGRRTRRSTCGKRWLPSPTKSFARPSRPCWKGGPGRHRRGLDQTVHSQRLCGDCVCARRPGSSSHRDASTSPPGKDHRSVRERRPGHRARHPPQARGAPRRPAGHGQDYRRSLAHRLKASSSSSTAPSSREHATSIRASSRSSMPRDRTLRPSSSHCSTAGIQACHATVMMTAMDGAGSPPALVRSGRIELWLWRAVAPTRLSWRPAPAGGAAARRPPYASPHTSSWYGGYQ